MVSGKKFREINLLKFHKNSHQKIRNIYSCDKYTNSFSTKSGLRAIGRQICKEIKCIYTFNNIFNPLFVPFWMVFIVSLLDQVISQQIIKLRDYFANVNPIQIFSKNKYFLKRKYQLHPGDSSIIFFFFLRVGIGGYPLCDRLSLQLFTI